MKYWETGDINSIMDLIDSEYVLDKRSYNGLCARWIDNWGKKKFKIKKFYFQDSKCPTIEKNLQYKGTFLRLFFEFVKDINTTKYTWQQMAWPVFRIVVRWTVYKQSLNVVYFEQLMGDPHNVCLLKLSFFYNHLPVDQASGS